MTDNYTLILPGDETLEAFQDRLASEPGSLNDALLAGIEGADGEVEMLLIAPGASLEDIRSALDVHSRPPSDPDLNRTPKTKV